MPTGHGMASRVAGRHPASRMQATVLSPRRDRVWDSATRRTWEVPTREGSRQGRTSFDDVYDVVAVVCLLALIGLVVFGGALMFLSRVTAVLPVSPRIACAELDGCVVTGTDENEAALVDDHRTDGPKLTR
jgi:hypothetical protein